MVYPAVGTVVEQVAAEEEAPDAAEARRLANQRGAAALLKRFFVLHGGKVVAFTVWWAAIQRPGAIGWLLTGAVNHGRATRPLQLSFTSARDLSAARHSLSVRAGHY